MSEDPKGFAAGDYNLFRYCKNDPLDLTDPMGLVGNGAVSANVDKSVYGMLVVAEFGKPLGSLIPSWMTVATIPVTFTTSGNFSNADANAHVVASLGTNARGNVLKGRIDTGFDVKRQQRGLVANLDINYYIIAAKYNDLERQHTFGDLGGGSNVKGLLEKGGYWDKAQQAWKGGISDWHIGSLFTAEWRLKYHLGGELANERFAQHLEWDQTQNSGHDVTW